MTQTGYTNAIVNLMLGWLKGLANWVLKLFNLAGSSGGSPLLWLSQNWLKLLILLLLVGVAVDWLVWMIRWRPYWVWFRKKRIIVNDERFFRSESAKAAPKDDLFECEYVVSSETVRRDERRAPVRQPAKQPDPQETPRRRPGETLQERTEARRVRMGGSRADAERGARPAIRRSERTVGTAQRRKPRPYSDDEFSDDLFEVSHDHSEYSDFFEDEVFNVSNLPGGQENDRSKRSQRRRR